MIKFVEKVERENTIIIDGYTTIKSVNRAIKDIGRYIKNNISKTEGEMLISNTVECLSKPIKDEYSFILEEVECASKLNEETDKIEYDIANFYFCIVLIK